MICILLYYVRFYGHFDRMIVLKQATLHHRPLDHRTLPNTRPDSRTPALISLTVLINLRTLRTPIMPIKLINSVILASRISQNNSNHLLGFRGMRTWPGRVSMQRRRYFWLGFDCPRLVVAKLSQKHDDSLAFVRLVPLSSLLRLFLPPVWLFLSSRTLTPCS